MGRGDRGTSLIEALIATLVALIGVFGLGSLIFEATVTNKNQGTEVTRATIYAQDKMEKLLSLDFTSCNTSTPPAGCNTTNISASGWNQGLLAGGTTGEQSDNSYSAQLTCPGSGSSIGYMDFLSADGIQLPTTGAAATCSAVPTPAGYIRMWQITDATSTSSVFPSWPGAPGAKEISVAVYSVLAVNSGATKPIVVLTSYLSDPN